MPWQVAAAVVAAVFATSAVSSVFGMAGGMMLMGVLAWLLPVAPAMVLHGAVQATANGYRAWLNRQDVVWPIFLRYCAGSLVAVALMMAVRWLPDKTAVFLLMGAVPFAAWAVPQRWAPDAQRPMAAMLCGLLVTGLQLGGGVAGALLDVFFVRTTLTRHQVVATKAVTQVLSHAAKLAYFGWWLQLAAGDGGALPNWVLAAGMATALAGTLAGKNVLDRLSDAQFRAYTQRLVLAIGGVMLWRGAVLWWRGG